MSIEKLLKALKQKTTWACALLIATMALPKFGVSAEVIDGIRIVLVALAGIFARQGIQKVQDK